MALAPPPSQIFSPSLRTCDIRSARNRMLASNLAEVGSTFVVRTFEACDLGRAGVSLRSAMSEQSGLITVYHSRGGMQCGAALRRQDHRPARPPDRFRKLAPR